MKLKALTPNYFMSFGPAQTVSLADRGLVLINGVNEISDSASSNGAGKTNLQEALLWALYGKTTKEVPVNDVVNNIHKKDCFVQAVFEDGEYQYHVHRYRKHSEFADDLHFFRTKDGEKENLAGVDKAETQKRIEQFMGCGFTLFCNSAYFSQNNVKPFCTYTDKQIKEVLLEALDMGRFTIGLERARFALKTLREELATIEGKKGRLHEEWVEAKDRLSEYTAKDANFASEKAKTVQGICDQIKTVMVQIKTVKESAPDAATIHAHIAEHEKHLAKLPESLATKTSLEGAAHQLREMYNVLKYKEKAASNQLIAKNTELESASARIGTNCSECGKPITAADLEEVVASIKVQIIAIQADYVKYRDVCSKAAPKLDEYSEKVSTADLAIAECRKAEKAISALRESLAKAEAVEETVKHLEGQIQGLKDRRIAEDSAGSPWKTLIEKETKAVAETATKIVNIEKVAAEKQEEIQYAEYWETAFGYSGIPSFILDSLTPFLNERANHHSSTVTGGEIEIEFATVSKTKKGELKDKFAINITHKSGAKSYKGSSGGEQQRADVCIAQSIQDLVRSFGRNTLSYCSYDEPFESLDQEGIANVVEMLNEISREIGTVLVVTHNDELKAMFDNTITVTKKKDGYTSVAA